MWKKFFSLYFEKVENPVVRSNSIFGFRFFMNERKDVLERLEKKLLILVKYMSENFIDGISIPLTNLYNAMCLWIRDNRLLIADAHVEYLGDSYCVDFLKDLWSEGSHAWLNLIPKQKLLPKSEKTHPKLDEPNHFISSDRALSSTQMPAPEFIIRQLAVESLDKISLAFIREIFWDELSLLKRNGGQFRKMVVNHSMLDANYVAHIQNLYLNETKRNTIEKKCSSTWYCFEYIVIVIVLIMWIVVALVRLY